MIKFILLFLFCFALDQSAFGEISEDKVGNSGYNLKVDLSDKRCCKDSVERESSKAYCLGNRNSKKVAQAILDLIKLNPEAHLLILIDLKLFEFFAGTLGYAGLSNHIVTNSFNYKGYDRLKQLMKKLRVCSKVCKVFFHLRQSLIENAAQADIQQFDNPDGFTTSLYISSDLIMVSDVIVAIENAMAADPSISQVIFHADAVVLDHIFVHEKWHGKYIIIKTKQYVVPKSIMMDVTGDYDLGEEDGGIMTCGNPTRNVFPNAGLMTFPDIVDGEC